MSAVLREERSVAGARTAESAPAAVSVRQVSKTFRLPHERYHTLKERALHPFRNRGFDVLRAVDDVSVEIPVGQFFGIVGRNGSGKSTLLKCLAGIYEIDSGELTVRGRLSPFIELGVGFNPELTARDNVIINAIMLGLSRQEAHARFDQVVAFAELEDFLDLKLKNYSSGMQVRLAFATAVQVDADILLIDEVLAVGDAAFQQKCFDELTRLRDSGRTMLFVTHDMGAIQRVCDRAMLLDRGRIVDIGEPPSIARQYNELNFRRIRKEAGSAAAADAGGTGPVLAAEVLTAWFESPQGEIIDHLFQGDECHVRMSVGFKAAVEDPVFTITLQNEHGYAAFVTSTTAQEIATGRFEPGTRASVELGFDWWLAPGRYRLIASVGPGSSGHVYDTNADSAILVHPRGAGGGMADPPHTLEVRRA